MTQADRFTGHDLSCIRAERLVFQGVGFDIASGGALKLTGPNGSGKSSLLRLMAGLLRPASGTLAWNGGDPADEPGEFRAALRYLGHQDAVKPALTVAENLDFWASLAGARGDGTAALSAFGLAALAPLPARFLSAGQRRRLALARLVAAPGRLWLLDEPTVGLDRASVAALEAAVARHRDAGGLVVVATHTEIALPGAAELGMERFAPARPAAA
ncbi:MAG TPA: heme ABC exporter ATP-binding protein CcmA [Alphaproteobacteria bacterium]|jgi:heme exporter protein A|nr:heme ABC exporter ATP-binding protein CcmA [Alphaproteobacteria bacterium]